MCICMYAVYMDAVLPRVSSCAVGGSYLGGAFKLQLPNDRRELCREEI